MLHHSSVPVSLLSSLERIAIARALLRNPKVLLLDEVSVLIDPTHMMHTLI